MAKERISQSYGLGKLPRRPEYITEITEQNNQPRTTVQPAAVGERPFGCVRSNERPGRACRLRSSLTDANEHDAVSGYTLWNTWAVIRR